MLFPTRVDSQDDLTRLARALGARPTEELRAQWAAVNGLTGLWRAGPEALPALSAAARRRLEAILELYARLLRAPPAARPLEGPADVAAYLGAEIPLLPYETFWTVALDARGFPAGRWCVGKGTLNACLVHPREVFAPALRVRAHAVLVAHNHPSGDPTPSPEDLALTERLVAAGDLLGIPLVDHVLVARAGVRSLGGGGGAAGPRAAEP